MAAWSLVRAGALDHPGAVEIREAAGDPRPIPAGAILIGEEDEVAVGVGARRRPRGLQLHQRDQAQGLGLIMHQLEEDLAEAKRLPAEVVAHEGLARMGRIALVEDEIDHREHGGQARGQIVPLGHLVGQAAIADRPLRAHEPLGDRRLGHEERAGDLPRRETADQAQGERDAAVGGEARMAAREDQPEPVVGNRLGVHRLRAAVHRAQLRLVGKRVAAGRGPPCTAQTVERAAPRRGQEPGARALGQAIGGPARHRLLEGGLGNLFRRVDVAHDPEHGGDEARVLEAEDLGHARTHVAPQHRPVFPGPTGRSYPTATPCPATPRATRRRRRPVMRAAPDPAQRSEAMLTSPRSGAPRRSRLRPAESSSPTRWLPPWCRSRSGRSRPGPPWSRRRARP